MDLVTKLYHGRKQDSAGWEGIPVYDCSKKEAVFIIFGKGLDQLILRVLAVK